MEFINNPELNTRFDKLLERLSAIETQLEGIKDELHSLATAQVPIISKEKLKWYEDIKTTSNLTPPIPHPSQDI